MRDSDHHPSYNMYMGVWMDSVLTKKWGDGAWIDNVAVGQSRNKPLSLRKSLGMVIVHVK